MSESALKNDKKSHVANEKELLRRSVQERNVLQVYSGNELDHIPYCRM